MIKIQAGYFRKENFKYSISFLITLILIVFVCIILSIMKSGMFIDEIYTYGLSNGHYTPFLYYIKDPGVKNSIIGEIFTRNELLNYITVNDGELFDFSSVYFNQTNDVHPPLYYWIINIFSSFTPGIFSKWTGLILNLILYIFCQILIYKIVKKMGGTHTIGIVSMILYGLSPVGLSTFLMIRMYILVTVLTLVLIWLILNLIIDFQLKNCILTSITILAGLLTQYYFVFYAALLCFTFCIFLIFKKQWRSLSIFSSSAILGVVAFVAIYPAALTHLFNSQKVNGTSVIENLFSFSQYPSRIYNFLVNTIYGLPCAVLLGFFVAVIIMIKFKKIKLSLFNIQSGAVILIPSFVTLFITAIISPYVAIRYAYNVMPVFVLTVSFLMILILKGGKVMVNFSKLKKFVLISAVGIFTLISTSIFKPSYLYLEHENYNNIVNQYKELPVVYFTSDMAAPLSQDLLQLISFEEIYVDDGNNFNNVTEYTNDAEKMVVYISIYKSDYKPEQLLSDFCEHSGYTECEKLYTYGLSKAYLVSK